MKFISTSVAGLLAIVGAALSIVIATPAQATVFTFDTDPFAGSDALTTPGRQIVGGEPFISFAPAADSFAISPSIFGIVGGLHVVNDVVGNLPTSGANVIVLQTLDNDNDDTTPFNAGSAADLIAQQITSDGAGFFVYYNSVLDVLRLVYSTNLNDNGADLKVLARMTNLDEDQLPDFTAANFTDVPEPSGLLVMMAVGGMLFGAQTLRRRQPV